MHPHQLLPASRRSSQRQRKSNRSAFAEPDKRAYPIEDKPHARNAKARASQQRKAGRLSKDEQERIDRKADKILGN